MAHSAPKGLSSHALPWLLPILLLLLWKFWDQLHRFFHATDADVGIPACPRGSIVSLLFIRTLGRVVLVLVIVLDQLVFVLPLQLSFTRQTIRYNNSTSLLVVLQFAKTDVPVKPVWVRMRQLSCRRRKVTRIKQRNRGRRPVHWLTAHPTHCLVTDLGVPSGEASKLVRLIDWWRCLLLH